MQGESSDHACVGIAEPKSWDACIQIVNKVLWIKSGHADKYNENMFKTLAGDVKMAVKPMNCPCHILIFNSQLRSWRDLPMRLAEFGKCHRYEPAGTMHGLMRVCGFVQDDAHIFCTEDQIASESVYAAQTAKAQATGKSNCPYCAMSENANKNKIWKITEMDADHVTAWSKGGATDRANCEMLCKSHNRAKGNR